MITSLKIRAGDLSIEVEGDGSGEIRETLEKILHDPDIRLLAGLSPLAEVRKIKLDGKTVASSCMRTPETEGVAEGGRFSPLGDDWDMTLRCAWCGKELEGLDWVRITLVNGKTVFCLCPNCNHSRIKARVYENWKVKL